MLSFPFYHRCSSLIPLSSSISSVSLDTTNTCVNLPLSLELSPAMTQLHHLMQKYLQSIVGLSDANTTSALQSITVSVAISCGDPGIPPNAVVSRTQSWTYGSVLQYSCLPGGVLVGNTTRHCQEDGTWSGAPPYCTGNSTPVDLLSYRMSVNKNKTIIQQEHLDLERQQRNYSDTWHLYDEDV